MEEIVSQPVPCLKSMHDRVSEDGGREQERAAAGVDFCLETLLARGPVVAIFELSYQSKTTPNAFGGSSGPWPAVGLSSLLT